MEFDSTDSIERTLRNANLTKAEEDLAKTEAHLEHLRREPEHEDRTDALHFGRENRLKARHLLRDAIITEAQQGSITYDESLALLQHFEFQFEGDAEVDYKSLLNQFVEGDEILLKRGIYYSDHVLGNLASSARLVPHKLKFKKAILPAIYVSVMSEGSVDMVHVSIRENDIEGKRTYGVVLGAEAIEEYLKTNR